ncbi:MAG: helix-turn-helix domain-containing protein [Chthonomonadales bacterium]
MQKRNVLIARIRDPETRSRVGERIKVAAASAGISLKDLAIALGLRPVKMYQYVRGVTSVPPDVLDGICERTNVTLEFFDPDRDARSAFAAAANAELPLEVVGGADRASGQLRQLELLANAYDEPRRNPNALASVLHEMLGVAKVLSDRKAEAVVLARLGRVECETGNLSNGRIHLTLAKELFAILDMERHVASTALDLAACALEEEDYDGAIEQARVVGEAGPAEVRWRGHLAMARAHLAAHRKDLALRAILEAGRTLEKAEGEYGTPEGIAALTDVTAALALATGHLQPALSLWTRRMREAGEAKDLGHFLDALLPAVQVLLWMGRPQEARKHLDLAVTLGSFLETEIARSSLAQSLLAEVLAWVGPAGRAKDLARSAYRLALKAQLPRVETVASNAMASAYYVAGQYDDAASNASDAIAGAENSLGRTLDVVRARLILARTLLAMAGGEGASSTLRDALQQAERAREASERHHAPLYRLEAALMVARCAMAVGDMEKAAAAAAEAMELLRNGASDLADLMGDEEPAIPAILQLPELNLAEVFTGSVLDAPGLAWQAQYLTATLNGKRGGRMDFDTLREAAQTLAGMLAGMDREEAVTYVRRVSFGEKPEAARLLEDLLKAARTAEERQQAHELEAALSAVKEA